MGPLGGGSHVSTAGGLLAVILRFDEELAAPLSIHKIYGSVSNLLISNRPLRQLITSCYLSVICRKTGARRHCSGGQDSVLSTFASFRDDFEHRPAHF